MSRRIGRDRKRRLCPQCQTRPKMKTTSRCRECWNANVALYSYWRRYPRSNPRNQPVGYLKPRYNLVYEMRRDSEVA